MKVKQNTPTITILGEKCSGKTSFACTLASPKAYKYLRLLSEGFLRSSVQERKFVYSSTLNDGIFVFVKFDDGMFNTDDFMTFIIKMYASVLVHYGVNFYMKTFEAELLDYLKHITCFDERTSNQFDLLTDDEQSIFYQSMLDFIINFTKTNREAYIFSKVEKYCAEETKNKDKIVCVKELLSDFIEKSDCSKIFNSISELKKILFNKFSKIFGCWGTNGDYYACINFDSDSNSDTNFLINSLFGTNSSNSDFGKYASLENLCKDITYHVPMNKGIVELIKGDTRLMEIFSQDEDYNGYSLTLVDSNKTKGIEVNGPLILFNPLSQVNRTVLAEVQNTCSVKGPIFILNSMLDIFISECNSKNIDIFDLDIYAEYLSSDVLQEMLKEHQRLVNDDLLKTELIRGCKDYVTVLPYSLKPLKELPEYSLLNTWTIILNEYARYDSGRELSGMNLF